MKFLEEERKRADEKKAKKNNEKKLKQFTEASDLEIKLDKRTIESLTEAIKVIDFEHCEKQDLKEIKEVQSEPLTEK